MANTDESSQPSFDPHYEWQGEHHEWQGQEVPSIQDNINPKRDPDSPPDPAPRGADVLRVSEPPRAPDALSVMSKVFAIIVLATPLALLGGFSFPPLFVVFALLFLLCGMGGIVLPLVGLVTRSGRVFASGMFGAFVFTALCYGYYMYLEGVTMPC